MTVSLPPPSVWPTLFLLATALARPEPASAQQLRTFPAARPVLEHHEGPTALSTAATLGGAMGVAAVLYLAPDASGWERSGTLAFTTPFAAVGTALGLVLAVRSGGPDGDTAGRGRWLMPLTSVSLGVLGGGLGHRVGVQAEQGIGSARGLIGLMWVLSVPAVAFTSALYWFAYAES